MPAQVYEVRDLRARHLRVRGDAVLDEAALTSWAALQASRDTSLLMAFAMCTAAAVSGRLVSNFQSASAVTSTLSKLTSY